MKVTLLEHYPNLDKGLEYTCLYDTEELYHIVSEFDNTVRTIKKKHGNVTDSSPYPTPFKMKKDWLLGKVKTTNWIDDVVYYNDKVIISMSVHQNKEVSFSYIRFDEHIPDYEDVNLSIIDDL